MVEVMCFRAESKRYMIVIYFENFIELSYEVTTVSKNFLSPCE